MFWRGRIGTKNPELAASTAWFEPIVDCTTKAQAGLAPIVDRNASGAGLMAAVPLKSVPLILRAVVSDAADPVVFWLRVGTSPATIAARAALVPSLRR